MKSKSFIILAMLLVLSGFVFAQEVTDDFTGVWISQTPGQAFDPFIPSLMTITIVDGKFFVLENRHYVSEDGSIVAESAFGFFILSDGKLIREFRRGITQIQIEDETDSIRVNSTSSIVFETEPVFYVRASLSDFQKRIDYYQTVLD